jgi:ribonuclease HI
MPDSNDSNCTVCIELYADGSFCREVSIGAWAFKVPALGLEQVGSSRGSTVTRFEFLAALNGLEEILAVDESERPIHLFSDCESSVALISCLRDGEELKKPRRYDDRADLIPRLQSVLTRRQIQVTRYGGGSLDHQACHLNASRRLREEVDSDPVLHHQAALVRQRSRLDNLVKEREPLLDKLSRLDEEISLLQLQVETLQSAIQALGISASPGPECNSGASVELNSDLSSRAAVP